MMCYLELVNFYKLNFDAFYLYVHINCTQLNTIKDKSSSIHVSNNCLCKRINRHLVYIFWFFIFFQISIAMKTNNNFSLKKGFNNKYMCIYFYFLFGLKRRRRDMIFAYA